MPRIRDRLYRFRPAGAPGAASAAGVPADRGADLDAELTPLFADLAQVERRCVDIVARAERTATADRTRAVEQAHALVSTARVRMAGERDAAIVQVRQVSGARSADSAAEAARAAVAIKLVATQSLQDYVDLVAAGVRRLIDQPPGQHPPDAR